MEITWKVLGLINKDGVITQIKARATAIIDEVRVSRVFRSILTNEDDNSTFIEFEDVTESDVIYWMKEDLLNRNVSVEEILLNKKELKLKRLEFLSNEETSNKIPWK